MTETGAQASAQPWPKRGPARLDHEPDAGARAALGEGPAAQRWDGERGNPAKHHPMTGTKTA